MNRAQPEPQRTRIAVFGSVASERPAADDAGGCPPPVRAVLELVYESIAESAPGIVSPILDRAVGEGTISRVERHELLRVIGGSSATDDAAAAPARAVLREALAAVRRAAPEIAAPILREAVGSERLTRAQEQRILERLRTSPASALARPAPGRILNA
jgi:hypothetical protein